MSLQQSPSRHGDCRPTLACNQGSHHANTRAVPAGFPQPHAAKLTRAFDPNSLEIYPDPFRFYLQISRSVRRLLAPPAALPCAPPHPSPQIRYYPLPWTTSGAIAFHQGPAQYGAACFVSFDSSVAGTHLQRTTVTTGRVFTTRELARGPRLVSIAENKKKCPCKGHQGGKNCSSIRTELRT